MFGKLRPQKLRPRKLRRRKLDDAALKGILFSTTGQGYTFTEIFLKERSKFGVWKNAMLAILIEKKCWLRNFGQLHCIFNGKLSLAKGIIVTKLRGVYHSTKRRMRFFGYSPSILGPNLRIFPKLWRIPSKSIGMAVSLMIVTKNDGLLYSTKRNETKRNETERNRTKPKQFYN